MIKNFKCKDTERLYNRKFVKKFSGIERQALMKLDRVDATPLLSDLTALPGNRFDALTGDRDGQFSVRVNDQYGVCFKWKEDNAFDVEIVDYH